jgi:hypothetical protein
MRIAVIGGTGIVGRRTVEALGHAAGEALLPGPEGRVAPTTFDAWLAAPRGALAA